MATCKRVISVLAAVSLLLTLLTMFWVAPALADDGGETFSSEGTPGPTTLEAETYSEANIFELNTNTDGRYSDNKAYAVPYNKGGSIQTDESLASVLDRRVTPFLQFDLDAAADGTYTIDVRFRYLPYDFPQGQQRNPTVNLLVNDGAPQRIEITTPSAGGSADVAKTIPITVELHKGRNVLRLTGMTADFLKYRNQYATNNKSNNTFAIDYLKIPEGVYGLAPAKQELAANSAKADKYYQNMTPSSDSTDFWGLKYDSVGDITADTLTVRDLPFVPYFAMTFDVPMDGYYNIAPIPRYAATDTVALGVLVDGVNPDNKPRYPSTGGSDNKVNNLEADYIVHLSQGTHVISFTGLMTPKAASSMDVTNFYKVVVRGGVQLAQKQEDPMKDDTGYTRIEAEDYGDWVESKMYTASRESNYSGGRAVEVYNYDAQHIQTAADMQTKLDKYQTPYVAYTIDAPEAGTYTLYVGVRFIGFLPDKSPDIAVIVNNGAPEAVTLQGEKGGDSKPTRLTVALQKGRNTVRITSYTRTFVEEVKQRAEAEEEGIENANNFYMAQDYLDIPSELTPVLLGIKDPDYQILEAETQGLGNLIKRGSANSGIYSGGSGNGDSKMERTQTLADIRANGLDQKKTPFTLYTVYAPEDGTYDVVARLRCGRYGPNQADIYNLTAHAVVVANDDITGMGVIDFPISQDKGDWTVRETVTLKLKKGENKIRVSALTADLTDADGQAVLWNNVNEAFLWLDHDYIAVPKGITPSAPIGGRIEAEDSLYAYYTHDMYSTSGGFVGLRDENNTNNSITYDITYDTLNEDNMSLIHMVHYKVIAPEDGVYDVAIALRATDSYGDSTVDLNKVVGFVAVMVNTTDKYKVEFHLGYKSIYTQLRLKKGLNTVSVSGTLREMLDAEMDPVHVSLRIDQDYLDLGPGLEAYDEGNTNPGDDDVATPLIETTRGSHAGGSTLPTTPPTGTTGDGQGSDDPGDDSAATGVSSALPLGLGLAGVSGAAAALSAKRRKKSTDS